MVILTTTNYNGYYNSTYTTTVENADIVDLINALEEVKGYSAEVGDSLLAYSTFDNKSHVFKLTSVLSPKNYVEITPTIANSGTDILFRFYAIRDDSLSGGNNIYEANGAGDDPITLNGTFKSDGYFSGHIVTSLPADTSNYQNRDIISINDATYNGSLLVCNKDDDIWEQLVISLNNCSFYDQQLNITKYIGNIGVLNEYFYALSDYVGYYYTNIELADINTTITLYKDGTYVLIFNTTTNDDLGANLFIAESGAYVNITGDTYYKYIFRDKRSSNLYLIDTDLDTSTVIVSGQKVDAAVVQGYVNLKYADDSISSNLFKSATQTAQQSLSSNATGPILFAKQPPPEAKVIIGDYATSPNLKVSYTTIGGNEGWYFNSSAVTGGTNTNAIFEYSENGLNVTLIYSISKSALSFNLLVILN